MHALTEAIKHFLDSSPQFAESFTMIVRIALPILSLVILSGAFFSLFTIPRGKEVFAKLRLTDRDIEFPIHHLESLVKRSNLSNSFFLIS